MKRPLVFIFCLVIWPTFLDGSLPTHKMEHTVLKLRQVNENSGFELKKHVFYDKEFRDQFGPDKDDIEVVIMKIIKLLQEFLIHKSLNPKICITVVGITYIDDIFATTYKPSHSHKNLQ